MSDQNLNTAQPEPEKVQPTSTATVTTGGKTFTEAEVEQMLKDRLSREKAKQEKAVQEAAAKAEAEAAAKNGEWEKVAKANEAKLTELQTALKAKELADLKRTIAEKVGLPLTLAARLMGETEADIENDAKALLETLPKAQKPAPGIVPNPGGGAQSEGKETHEQARSRILGIGNSNWSADTFIKMGGGVVTSKPKE